MSDDMFAALGALQVHTLQRLGVDAVTAPMPPAKRQALEPSSSGQAHGSAEAAHPDGGDTVDGGTAAAGGAASGLGSMPLSSPREESGAAGSTAGAGGPPGRGTGVNPPRQRLGTLASSFGVGSAAAGRLGSLRDGGPGARPGSIGLGAGTGPAGTPGGSGAAGAGGAAGLIAASAARAASQFAGAAVGPGAGAAPPLSAAALKAAAARGRVPSPEPGPRKPKPKCVSWATDESLVATRWFKKVSDWQQLGGG